MAGSLRAGFSAFWTTVRDLSLASAATAKDLYGDGINRLSDRTVWLRDQVTKVRSDLANVSAGTKATVTGGTDLSTLIYDDVIGDLNSKTFQSQADTGGVKTITFGTGAGQAPTGPADAVSQINAQTSGQPFVFVDAAGHLNVQSTTTGSGSTITVFPSGSASSLLGFSGGGAATGVATGADGISAVGGAAITGSKFNLSAGTLRSMLQAIANTAASDAVAAYVGEDDIWTIVAGPLADFLHLLADHAARLDATFQTFTGAFTVNGAVQMGSAIVLGSTTLQGTTTIAARCIPRSARVPVADGNKRLGVAAGSSIDYHGKRFTIVVSPAAVPNVLILDKSNAAPAEGETIEILCGPGLTGSDKPAYRVTREDGTSIIAQFNGSTGTAVSIWAEFEFVSGEWRLGANSGSAYDSGSTTLRYGVIPGSVA